MKIEIFPKQKVPVSPVSRFETIIKRFITNSAPLVPKDGTGLAIVEIYEGELK